MTVSKVIRGRDGLQLVSLVISAVMMLMAGSAAAQDVQPSELSAQQVQARQVFMDFVQRFADNVEPVEAQLVVDCITIYNDALKQTGFSSEQVMDIFGSKTGWGLAATAKASRGETLPVSKFFVADDTQTISASRRDEMLTVLAECRRNEERAHVKALQGEGVK